MKKPRKNQKKLEAMKERSFSTATKHVSLQEWLEWNKVTKPFKKLIEKKRIREEKEKNKSTTLTGH